MILFGQEGCCGLELQLLTNVCWYQHRPSLSIDELVGIYSPLKSSISASSCLLSIPCESLFCHRQGSRGRRSPRVSERTANVNVVGPTAKASSLSGGAGTHHESQGTGVDVGMIHAAVDFICTVPVRRALVLVTEPPRLRCITAEEHEGEG